MILINLPKGMTKCSLHHPIRLYQILTSIFYSVMNDLEFNNEKQKASCTTADPEDDNIKSAWFLELTPPTAARKSFPAGVLDLDPQFRLRSEAREVKYQNILTQINSQREEEVNLLVKDLEEISKMTRHSYLSSSSKQNSLESSDDRPEVVSLNSKRIPGKVKLTVPKMTTNLHLSSESSEDGPDHIRNEYTPFNRNDNQVWQSVILGSHFMQEVSWPGSLK
jgi:hypothetical protein